MQDVHGFGPEIQPWGTAGPANRLFLVPHRHCVYTFIQSTKTLTGNAGANRLKFNWTRSWMVFRTRDWNSLPSAILFALHPPAPEVHTHFVMELRFRGSAVGQVFPRLHRSAAGRCWTSAWSVSLWPSGPTCLAQKAARRELFRWEFIQEHGAHPCLHYLVKCIEILYIVNIILIILG